MDGSFLKAWARGQGFQHMTTGQHGGERLTIPRWRCSMPQHYDPMEEVMRRAERKILEAGIAGDGEHQEVDQGTIIMASLSWAVREIKTSNSELVAKVTGENSDLKTKIKKNGPAGAAGALVVGVFAFIKDWISS